MVDIRDKGQITVGFDAGPSGEFLPIQFVFKGKSMKIIFTLEFLSTQWHSIIAKNFGLMRIPWWKIMNISSFLLLRANMKKLA